VTGSEHAPAAGTYRYGASSTGSAARAVRSGGPVRAMPHRWPSTDLLTLRLSTDRFGDLDIGSLLRVHGTIAFIVVQGGAIVLETGATNARHLCYSVTKSVTGLLAELVIEDGALARTDRVDAVVPELRTSALGTATVGDLCDMTAAIDYVEDYDAPAADGTGPAMDFGDYLWAIGAGSNERSWQASIRTFLARLGSTPTAHGERFAYATPVTDALAWAIERATGVGYVEHVEHAVWGHVGAEDDAAMSTDPVGVARAGGGLSVTTRDLARFGLWLVERRPGVVARIREETTEGHRARFSAGVYGYLEGFGYRSQWWIPPGGGTSLMASGIFGQLLWVDPAADLVIAAHCQDEVADVAARDVEQVALCRVLTRELTGVT
jgi:CubicO group peptidase (beta-lactamase class C family)